MIRKGHIRYSLKKSTDDRIFLQISYGHAESTHGNLPDSDLDERQPIVVVEMYDRSIKNMETMMRYAKKTLGIKTDTEIPISVIESWLYSIAVNNYDNPLGESCEEIIRRLDGLERYYMELHDERGDNNGDS